MNRIGCSIITAHGNIFTLKQYSSILHLHITDYKPTTTILFLGIRKHTKLKQFSMKLLNIVVVQCSSMSFSSILCVSLWRIVNFTAQHLWQTHPLSCRLDAARTFRACVPPWPLQGQLRRYAAISKHATTVKFGNELSINDVRLLQVLRVHHSSSAKECEPSSLTGNRPRALEARWFLVELFYRQIEIFFLRLFVTLFLSWANKLAQLSSTVYVLHATH